MPYIHFTDEQKRRANDVDLVEFLRRQGERLIPSGRDMRLESDHSVTVRGSQWYDHAIEKGGGAVSFLQYHYGASYVEAVSQLLGGEGGRIYAAAQQMPQEKKEFALPPANRTMRRVYAYLMKQRQIDREVFHAYVHDGLLYESCEPSKDGSRQYHNAIFVGKDENGVARHAHKKGLNTVGPSFRGNIEGGDPRCSFHYVGVSDRLYVFEAPIDLMSFNTLYQRDWQEHSYVALCGTGSQAMRWMLEQDPDIRRVALCLDNDKAGRKAMDRLMADLREKGYDTIQLLPEQGKDWNESLQILSGHAPGQELEDPDLSMRME